MTINPRQFLSEAEELHALTIGLCEVLAFFIPRLNRPSRALKASLSKEYHYYMLGRALGIPILISTCCIIKEVFF